jgi:hypothetical protein
MLRRQLRSRQLYAESEQPFSPGVKRTITVRPVKSSVMPWRRSASHGRNALRAFRMTRPKPRGRLNHLTVAGPFRPRFGGGGAARRGNPYDNAKAESFMKTLKVEAVYPMAFESFEDVAEHLPHFIERSTTSAGCIQRSVI